MSATRGRWTVVGAVGLVLGLASATRATDAPAPLADTWRVGSDRGAPRLLQGEDLALSLTLEWPSRGSVGLRGCVNGSTLTLTAEVEEGRGLTGAVRNEAARSKLVHLSLVGRVERTPDGDAIAARLLEDGRAVASERWIRPGPAAIEILDVTGGARFEPKKGPLTITFRVKNRPIPVRFRAELAGARVVDFYEEQVAPARRREGRIAIVERSLSELEPGEHALEWDGRDDTPTKRLALAGQCTLVLEDVTRPQEVRAERLVIVAPPVVRYVGPRWPREVRADGSVADPGRDRARSFRAVTEGFTKLGFASSEAKNDDDVSAEDLLDALSSSAAVVVATHGFPAQLALYDGPGDAVETEEHVVRVDEHDLKTLDRAAWRAGRPRPLRDLHVVVLWACMAGSAVERDERGAPRAPSSIFVGLPARLRACGADIVVAFSRSIIADSHQDFVERLLRDLLQERSIGEASRAAADAADARHWGNPARDAERRASGAAPLKEALTIFPPDTQTDRERLDPACWGISTN